MTVEKSSEALSTQALLAALVALAVDEREAALDVGARRRKTEVLLADAGVATRDIAAMLGKNEAAVAKAISRARRQPAVAKPKPVS